MFLYNFGQERKNMFLYLGSNMTSVFVGKRFVTDTFDNL